MTIHEEARGDVLVLAPDGALTDSEDVAALETRLAAAVKAKTRAIVVDGAGVDELTSPAIRVLLMATRKLARARGRLVLCALTPKVQRAFALAGFDRDFTVVPTRDEAVHTALQPAGAPAASQATTAVPSPQGTPARHGQATQLLTALGHAAAAPDAVPATHAGGPHRAAALLAALAHPAVV